MTDYKKQMLPTTEKFSTIKIPIRFDDLTTKKKQLLQDWFAATNEIANLHLEVIRQTKQTDYSFLHKFCYDQSRKKHPSLPSSTIKHVRDNVISLINKDPSLLSDSSRTLKCTPVFIDRKALKISESEKSKTFNFWVSTGKKLMLPFNDKPKFEKLKKMGLLENSIKSDTRAAQFAEQQQLIDLSQKDFQNNGASTPKTQTFTGTYNSAGYRLVRGMFIRKKSKYFLYITVACKKPDRPVFKRRRRIVREVEVIYHNRIEKSVPDAMLRSKCEEPSFFQPSYTVFKRVDVSPSREDEKNGCSVVTVLSFPKWRNSDDKPIPSIQTKKPGKRLEQKVSGNLYIDPYASSIPFRDLLMDPSDDYLNLRTFNAEHICPKGLEPITLTKIFFEN